MWDDAINRRGDFQKQRVTSSVNTTYFWLASKSSCPIQCFLFHLQKCKDACFVHPFWQCIIAGVTFPRINSFEIWIWSGVGKLIAPIFFFLVFSLVQKTKWQQNLDEILFCSWNSFVIWKKNKDGSLLEIVFLERTKLN